MKKIILSVAVTFLLGACLPLPFATSPTPVVDIAATSAANVMNSAAQTLAVQPTNTFFPPTETASPTVTLQDLFSPTLPPSITPETTTVVTATYEVATSTSALTALPAGPASLTPTLGVLTYGTLPPEVPFSDIFLVNRSKRQAYISLQVITEQGGPTVIEYPVNGRIKIKAPLGAYFYVAWVGGREMTGDFKLHKGETLTIILYKDKVVIQ